AAGVALVAEAMPARARPFALGLVQAFSSVGAIIGSGLSLVVRPQTMGGQTAGWRVLFAFGAVPSPPVGLVPVGGGEPQRWLRARDVAKSRAGLQLGDLRAIFGDPVLRRRTVIGMILGMVGQIGLWSIALFTPELVRGSLLAQRRSEVESFAASQVAVSGL